MNYVIAYKLLTTELGAYRKLAYDEVRQLVGELSERLIHGPDGVDYNLAVYVNWRCQQECDIRVTGLISEANWGGPNDSLDETFVASPPA
jgi:hypothetical protein